MAMFICTFITADGAEFKRTVDNTKKSYTYNVYNKGEIVGTRVYVYNKFRDNEFMEDTTQATFVGIPKSSGKTKDTKAPAGSLKELIEQKVKELEFFKYE